MNRIRKRLAPAYENDDIKQAAADPPSLSGSVACAIKTSVIPFGNRLLRT